MFLFMLSLFFIYLNNMSKEIYLLIIMVLFFINFILIFDKIIGIRKTILFALFCTLSFNIELSIFNYNSIYHTGGLRASITITHMYILILFLLFLYLFNKNNNPNKGSVKLEVLLFFLLFLIGGISLFVAVNKVATIYILNRYFFIMCLLIVLSKFKLNTIWNYFTFGVIVTIFFQFIVGVSQIITDGSIGLTMLGESNRPFRINVPESEKGMGGTLGHPGTLAIFLTLLFPFLLTQFINAEKIKIKVISIVALMIGFLSILLTNARTSIVLVVISTFVIVFGNYYIRNKHKMNVKKIKTYLLLILVLVTSGVIIMLDDIKERFLYSDFSFQIGGRTAISELGISVIFKNISNFLFGVGLNNYTDNTSKFGSDFLHTQPVHNLYLLFWAEGGMLYLLVYLLLLIIIIVKMIKVILKGSYNLATKALSVLVSLSIIIFYNFTGWSMFHNQLFFLFAIIVIISALVFHYYKKNIETLD